MNNPGKTFNNDVESWLRLRLRLLGQEKFASALSWRDTLLCIDQAGPHCYSFHWANASQTGSDVISSTTAGASA
jgi:hypothetical protein